MIYWSNHYGYVDINGHEYRLDNILYSCITRHEDEYYMGIYVRREYYKSITNTFQIPSNAHIIIEVEYSNVEYNLCNVFFNVPKYVENDGLNFYSKAYLVFPTKSELLKWKLKS